MAGTSYKDWLVDQAPPWLRQLYGEAFLRGVGDVHDGLLQRAKDGVALRFPYPFQGDRTTTSTKDALNAVGAERQIPRGPTETDAIYAARLVAAWESWPWAGTPYGLLQTFWDAGYENVHLVIQQGKSFRLNAMRELVTDVASGTFAFSPNFWNTFVVFFPSPLKASWVSGGVPASNSDEANYIRGLVNKWKPGHALVSSYTIQLTGQAWGLPITNTWGGSGLTWGSTFVVWTP